MDIKAFAARIQQWRNNALANADNSLAAKRYEQARDYAAEARAYNDVLDLLMPYL